MFKTPNPLTIVKDIHCGIVKIAADVKGYLGK